MRSVLMVIAPEVFRDEEYAVPKDVLEIRGASVTTASTHVGEAIGKLGMIAFATETVAQARTTTWDAVIFVGGAGSSVYFDDADAHRLAHDTLAREAVLAAICIAPSTLARAGLLEGVRATAFPSQRDDLVEHGAIWTGEPVTVDGLIVTANGPDAAGEFGDAVADLLGLPPQK